MIVCYINLDTYLIIVCYDKCKKAQIDAHSRARVESLKNLDNGETMQKIASECGVGSVTVCY